MSERLRQTGRFIYLLALFQLAGGPLVIGVVMLVGKITAGWGCSEALLHQAAACPAASINAATEERSASSLFPAIFDLDFLFEAFSTTASSSPQKPAPAPKEKDAKGKLWMISDPGMRIRSMAPTPLIACLPAESDWLVTRSHSPPIPPPRAV